MARLGNIFKTIGGIISRALGIVRGFRGAAAAGGVIGTIALAAKKFKDSTLMTRIGAVFSSVGRIIGNVLGISARGGARGGIAAGSFLAKITTGASNFLKSPVVMGIKGLFASLQAAFAGVVQIIRGGGMAVGGVARAGGMAVVGAAKASAGILGGLKNVISLISKFTGLSALLSWIGTISMATIGWIVWPLQAIFAVYGFVKGWRQEHNWAGQDATIKDKLLMGVEEAINQVIMLPLNMLKDMTGWLMDKMGLGVKVDVVAGKEMKTKAEWRQAMDNFDFTVMWQSFFRGIVGAIEGTVEWFGELFTDPGAMIAKHWKGVEDLGKWLYDNTIKGLIDWIKDIFDIDWANLGWSLLPDVVADTLRGASEEEKQRKAINERIDEITKEQTKTQSGITGSQQELKDLAEKRIEIEARESSKTGFFGDIFKYSDQNKADELAEIDAKMKAARGNIASGQEEMKRQNQLLTQSQIALTKIAKAGVDDKKSLAVYDRHLEELLQPMPALSGALLKAFAGQGGGGGGNSSVVTIVAPQTSNTTAAINQMTQTPGTSNPMTALARNS